MLDFWKSKEAKLLRLAAIARDILTILVASLSIKRVFSITYNICYFRQLVLALNTIQAKIVKYYYNHKDSKKVERF